MKLVRHTTVEDFWYAAGPLLTADPIRNTVALTVLARLRIDERFGEEDPIFLTVCEDDGRVVGAAFCTPPYPINVTAVPAEAMPLIVDHLVTTGIDVTTANGLLPQADAFVSLWRERTGAVVAHRMEQRLYRLGELRPPAGVAGEPVLGSADEVELLAQWRMAFAEEAEAHRADAHRADAHRAGDRWVESMRRQVRASLALGNAQQLWQVDRRPVSFAAVNVPKNGMSRIGPVYTPKEFRNHGYGGAVTAAASRWALDSGAEHVLLFTDLSNPVSNSIYQKLGYVPVADALDVTFTPRRLP
jgi:GNAT superfamily N-acetyltransferase